MAIGDIIVGIDIGTSKVCTVVGEVNNFGQIETICNTSSKCSGLKKGKIINEEEISLSIAKTINDAEEDAGFKINSAYVTIPGKYVTIVQNSIVKELKDKFAGIALKDVQNAIMQAIMKSGMAAVIFSICIYVKALKSYMHTIPAR